MQALEPPNSTTTTAYGLFVEEYWILILCPSGLPTKQLDEAEIQRQGQAYAVPGVNEEAPAIDHSRRRRRQDANDTEEVRSDAVLNPVHPFNHLLPRRLVAG